MELMAVDRFREFYEYILANRPEDLRVGNRQDMLTYTEWKHAFNSALGQSQMYNDWTRLKEAERRLTAYRERIEKMPQGEKDELKRDPDRLKVHKDNLKFFAKERDDARRDWERLWVANMKVDGDKLSREMPKQVQLSVVEKLSIVDINRIIKGEVVDVKDGD